MLAARSGKMPTTSVRRRISLCKRSLRVGTPELAPELLCGSAARPAGHNGLARGGQQPRAASQPARQPLVGTEPPPRWRPAGRRWCAPISRISPAKEPCPQVMGGHALGLSAPERYLMATDGLLGSEFSPVPPFRSYPEACPSRAPTKRQSGPAPPQVGGLSASRRPCAGFDATGHPAHVRHPKEDALDLGPVSSPNRRPAAAGPSRPRRGRGLAPSGPSRTYAVPCRRGYAGTLGCATTPSRFPLGGSDGGSVVD